MFDSNTKNFIQIVVSFVVGSGIALFLGLKVLIKIYRSNPAVYNLVNDLYNIKVSLIGFGCLIFLLLLSVLTFKTECM